MFVHMASGLHPLAPQLLGVITGMNVGIAAGMGRRMQDLLPRGLPQPSGWRPPPKVGCACALLVLGLELPAFWYSVAMGISMGQGIQGSTVTYGSALLERAPAYGGVIVPILLISAIAETVAMSGAAGADDRAGPAGEC